MSKVKALESAQEKGVKNATTNGSLCIVPYIDTHILGVLSPHSRERTKEQTPRLKKRFIQN
jgi:hypothetical protein